MFKYFIIKDSGNSLSCSWEEYVVDGIFLSQQCEAVEVLMFVFHTHIAPVLSATRILHSSFPLHLLHYISDAQMLWFHEHNFPLVKLTFVKIDI